MLKISVLILFWLFFGVNPLIAQDSKFKAAGFDGIVILGYVDNGGYTNFTGPNISYTHKNSKFLVSALPSLRYRKDTSTPKNSFITPSLGLGLTYTYRFFSFQIPFCYNTKTSSNNGSWKLGVGIGLKLNELKMKKRDEV